MPIYDYRCSNCSHELEALQKLSAAPLTTCPECGQETLRKQVSAPAFRLAGSGWYETDFKNLAGDGKEKSSSAEKSDSGKSEGGAKASSEGSSGSSGDGKKPSGQASNTTTK